MIHNIELEQSVLACLLIDKDTTDEIDSLKDEDFVHEVHKKIFQAIRILINEGKIIDFMTVYEKLGQTVELTYLTKLANSLPGINGFSSYVKQLKDLTVRRKLIQVLDISANKARNGEEDALEYAEREIYQISEDTGAENFVTPKELVTDVFKDIEERVFSDNTLSGFDTGFKDINLVTDGLQKGDLIIVAGRPSMGKTSLALNIAQNAARQDKVVATFSLEMSKNAIMKRMILSESSISDIEIRTQNLTEDDWKKVTKACKSLYDKNIFICDQSNITVSKMVSMCRKLRRNKGKLDLIVIDYLQLIKGKGNVRMEEITNISIALKGMAKELNCPVLALSQLSRACEQRQDKRPMLSDLRESGQIEQDADVVILLYRDEYYNRDSKDERIAEVIFAKQRNGPTAIFKLGYISEIATFVEIEKIKPFIKTNNVGK